MNLSPTQKIALELARNHKGLKRYHESIYWIGADIEQSKSEKRWQNSYPEEECVGTVTVNALIRMGVLKMKGETAIINECPWCSNKEYNRFECSLINDEGHSLVENNMVVTCIANYCPVCGRRLE